MTEVNRQKESLHISLNPPTSSTHNTTTLKVHAIASSNPLLMPTPINLNPLLPTTPIDLIHIKRTQHLNDTILFRDLPTDYIHEILKYAELLIPKANNSASYEDLLIISRIAKKLHEIPSTDRQDFSKLTLSLITPTMNADQRIAIMDAVGDLVDVFSREDRANITEHALSLITPTMDVDQRIAIVDALANIPSNPDRTTRVELILASISCNTFMTDRDILHTIQAMLKKSTDLIINKISDPKDKPLKILLEYYNKISIQSNASLPKIIYKDSVAIDAGGVTRDFISKLFMSIYSEPFKLPVKLEDNGCLPKFDKTHQIDKNTQVLCLKAIGTIFGAASSRNHTSSSSNNLTTGRYFHEVIFKMIHALSVEDITIIPENLSSDTNLPVKIFNNLLKVFLLDRYPLIFKAATIDSLLETPSILFTIEGLEEMQSVNGFLKDYPETIEILIAVAIIAKALHKQLNKSATTPKWPNTPEILSNTIQGLQIDKIQVRNALSYDKKNPSKETLLLLEWIDKASEDNLVQLIYAITGSNTLLPDTKLYICSSCDKQSFKFHTCTNTIDIKIGQTFLDFQKALNGVLKHSTDIDIM